MAELFDKGGILPPGVMIGRIGSTGKSTGPHLHFENVKTEAPSFVVSFDLTTSVEKQSGCFRSACARCGSIIAVHVCGENWAK